MLSLCVRGKKKTQTQKNPALKLTVGFETKGRGGGGGRGPTYLHQKIDRNQYLYLSKSVLLLHPQLPSEKKTVTQNNKKNGFVFTDMVCLAG